MRTPSKESLFGPQWLIERLAQLLPGFPNVPVCVALSGGLDSTALLAALAAARVERLRLRAAHINHGLHPNASRWSAHCRKLARQLEVPLRVLAVTVHRERGASVEEAARVARYHRLAQHLQRGEALLTAHTRDDQLETVLLQLFRGCGLAGLAAMPPLATFGAGWLTRPLLGCSHKDLEAWAQARGLAWIEDDTNLDERFDRNYLRRQVLPLVRERWPGVASAVARSARHAAEAQGLLTALARADLERARDGASLSVKVLRALTPDRRRNLLRLWIASSGRALPDTRRLEEIAGPLIEARPDAHPQVLWGGAAVQRHADLLSLADCAAMSDRQRAAQTHAELDWRWRQCSRCALPGGGALELVEGSQGAIDLDALPDGLAVRWRRGGERLRVRGGGPRRALKSLLQEAHVPLAERGRMPLIFAGGKLVAAADLWIDASVRAAPGAPHRARLLWHKSAGGAGYGSM
ncbi:MAG: tRNA lysidine(34) synthetase TilS [Steroidobacteraceae bacterium]